MPVVGHIWSAWLQAAAVLALVIAVPEPTFAQPNPHVVVLGSSTAAGTGPSDPENAWVARYTRYLKARYDAAKVTNLARNGNTTYHIQYTGFPHPPDRPAPDQDRNITRALSLDPTGIIVNLPSNDLTLGYDIEERFDNLDRVVEAAVERGIPIWITTPQPRNTDDATLALMASARDSTFAKYGSFAIDFWTGIAEPSGRVPPAYDSGDGIHLNDDAHAILADRVIASVDLNLIVGLEDHGRLPGIAPSTHFMVDMYPNPTDDLSQVTVAIESGCRCPLSVRVYDAIGRELGRLEVPASDTGQYTGTLEAFRPPLSQGWAPGAYFILVIGDRATAARVVVVER